MPALKKNSGSLGRCKR